jgi:aminomethyltransferase
MAASSRLVTCVSGEVMTGEDTKSLPLNDLHVAAGARFGAFAGWSMPLTYPPGVMKEHLHTREHAGLFDISHMRLFEVSGPGAAALLSKACPLNAGALEIRQSKYSFLLNEAAGIIDDLIVTRLDPERFMVVANAGNAGTDEAHLRALATDFDCKIDALDRVFLAVQGPEAWAAMSRAGIETGSLTFMQGFEPRPGWFMSRSGYTGEDGFEIALPEADARDLTAKLLADDRIMWVGLAARDSLRLEAGLCLHGNDITDETDPATAGLMWAIARDLRAGGGFVGAQALRDIVARGPVEKRVGLKPDGRQPVRAGTLLVDADGKLAGRVTSGGFGPSAGHPVAMGYASLANAKPGTRLFADVRGTKIPVDIQPLPFTPHCYRKG